jgi:hypothetical protein
MLPRSLLTRAQTEMAQYADPYLFSMGCTCVCAGAQLGVRRCALVCMDMAGCDAQRQRVLGAPLLGLYERLCAHDELRRANLHEA